MWMTAFGRAAAVCFRGLLRPLVAYPTTSNHRLRLSRDALPLMYSFEPTTIPTTGAGRQAKTIAQGAAPLGRHSLMSTYVPSRFFLCMRARFLLPLRSPLIRPSLPPSRPNEHDTATAPSTPRRPPATVAGAAGRVGMGRRARRSGGPSSWWGSLPMPRPRVGGRTMWRRRVRGRTGLG